jgi:swainsonine biosynthesis oxidoreductase SwnR
MRYPGRRLRNLEGGEERKYKSIATIDENLRKHAKDEDPTQLWLAYMDEWNVTGAACVPWDIVLRQRERYFKGLRFREIEELLEDAERMELV